jgi:hypothetical protein
MEENKAGEVARTVYVDQLVLIKGSPFVMKITLGVIGNKSLPEPTIEIVMPTYAAMQMAKYIELNITDTMSKEGFIKQLDDLTKGEVEFPFAKP